MKLKARDLCLCALGSVLMAVGAWISVPYTVPFTMQTFMGFFLAICLGPKLATVSLAVYFLLGTLGLPVFAGFGGGVGVILGPTGGYLVGFLPMVLLTGLFDRRGGAWVWVGMALGLLVCYALGTAWFYVVYVRSGSKVGLAAILSWCVIPYILPDVVKMALGFFAGKRMKKLLAK